MTYEDKEQSVNQSRPKEILDFADDFGNHWRYASGAENVSHLGQTYYADNCKISELEISENHTRNGIEVTLGRDNEFAVRYIYAPIESPVSLTIYRLQGADYVIYITTMVESVSFDNNESPLVRCYPKTSSMSRVGRRRRCQILCDHALYSQGFGECLVDQDSFKIEGIIDTVDGTTLISTSFDEQASGWLKGGEIVIGNARRLIKEHTVYGGGGGEIKISRTIFEPETNSAGDIEFVAYAGCDHSASVCASKFNNKVNFGGMQYLPVKNPFEGDSI